MASTQRLSYPTAVDKGDETIPLLHAINAPKDDEHSHGHSAHQAHPKNNIVFAICNLLNDIIGPASLASSYYIANGGFFFSLVAILFVATISAFTLRKLYYLCEKYNKSNYIDLCAYAFGTPGYLAACFFVFTYNFGVFISNMLFLGSVGPDVLQEITGSSSKFLDRSWVLLFCTALFFPVAFFKNIASFGFNSFLAISFILCTFAMIVISVFVPHTPSITVRAPELHDFTIIGTDPIQVLGVIGGISYIFVCHDISISVMYSLKNQTQRTWNLVVLFTVALTICILFVVGMSGYIMFYDDVKAMTWDNFGVHDVPATVGRGLILLQLALSIPYCCMMPRLSLTMMINLLSAHYNIKVNDTALHVTITVLILGSVLAIAEAVTDLALVLELVGGFSSAGLAFVMPPLVFIALEPGTIVQNKEKMVMIVIVCFGFFSLVSSTVSTIIQAV